MEKLYNNIVLPDDFAENMSDAQNVPYLKNPPEVINVSVGRQLFVDDFLIDSTDLVFKYHKAKKFEGNPVLKPEMPWEIEQSPVACPKSGGVWYDEEEKIFKMWYEAGWLHNMCYAISKDGINWERPDLKIVEGTNKILPYEGYEAQKLTVDEKYLRPDSTTVFIDYSSEYKYKLFLRNPGVKDFAIVAESKDGINFENFKTTSPVEDRSTCFYNPFRKKWVYSIRNGRPMENYGWYRYRNYRECDDFLKGATWNKCDEHFWLECDDKDLPDPYIRFAPQLYNVDCIGYESIMLGMFQIMYGPDNVECEKRGVPKITELMPMYSRDGYNFSRPCRDSIINASMKKGTWDRGYVQSVSGGVIINGDELWIYYTGFAGDENHANENWLATNGMYANGATGIAKLRRDGFVSLSGKGSITTRKLEFSGKSAMYVNAVGSISAQILDENGAVLDESDVFCGDSTKAELKFTKINIKDLNNKIFKLRFFVDGELYCFGFTDEKGDFGGARAAGIVE